MIWSHNLGSSKNCHGCLPLSSNVGIKTLLPLLIESKSVFFSHNFNIFVFPHFFCHIFYFNIFEEFISFEIFLDFLKLFLFFCFSWFSADSQFIYQTFNVQVYSIKISRLVVSLKDYSVNKTKISPVFGHEFVNIFCN